MIKIFDETDTDFSSNGNIALNPIKCKETKKKSLNGWFLEVEVDVKYKEYILQDKLCVVKTKSKLNPQAFRIKNVKTSNSVVSFTANHVMFDAADYFLTDVRPTKLNGQNALSYINERTDKSSPFKIYSNVSEIKTAYFIRKNLLEAWAIIEERWNGVFDADNWNINFLTKVGHDNGEVIAYGKNMQGIQVFEDWSNVCTKLYPVGYDGLLLPEMYLESEVQYKIPYTRTVDFSTDLDEDEKTEENMIKELREKATEYLKINQYPAVSYEVTSDINQNMEIGDTIQVKHPLVEIETEVLEYVHNIITDRIESLVFGNFTRNVKSKFDSIKENIKNLTKTVSNQEAVSAKQTMLINTLNKTGYVYIDDNEILILDKLPKEEAKNVWRFGLGGIGFSSNGYEGPFTVAATMDGQVSADFITTGTMSVERIEGLNNQISIAVEEQLEQTKKDISDLQRQKDDLNIKYDGLENSVTNTGGANLLRNSVGIFGSDYWNGNIVSTTATEIKNNSVSGSAIVIQKAKISQEVHVKNGKYNISFKYKKIKPDSTGYCRINNVEYELSSTEFTDFVKTVDITTNSIKIEFEADANNSIWITDLLIILGDTKQVWTQNQNETSSDTVKIGKGIQVESTSSNTYTRIDSDGNRTFNKTTKEVVAEQTDKGTKTKELYVKDLAQICDCVISSVVIDDLKQIWFSIID